MEGGKVLREGKVVLIEDNQMNVNFENGNIYLDAKLWREAEWMV